MHRYPFECERLLTFGQVVFGKRMTFKSPKSNAHSHLTGTHVFLDNTDDAAFGFVDALEVYAFVFRIRLIWPVLLAAFLFSCLFFVFQQSNTTPNPPIGKLHMHNTKTHMHTHTRTPNT